MGELNSGMFHRKPIVDNISLRRGVALLAVTFILTAAAPRAMAQKAPRASRRQDQQKLLRRFPKKR